MTKDKGQSNPEAPKDAKSGNKGAGPGDKQALRLSEAEKGVFLIPAPEGEVSATDLPSMADLPDGGVGSAEDGNEAGNAEAGNAEAGSEAGNAEAGNAEAGNAEAGNAEAGPTAPADDSGG